MSSRTSLWRRVLGSKKRALGTVGVLGALLLVAGCFPAPSQPPKVILYGDSLSLEAWPYFEAVINNHQRAVAVQRGAGGTAICDFFDEMEADKESVLPTVVVLSFVGNGQPACLQGRPGATIDKYREDAQHAINIWKARGVQVYLSAAPPRVQQGAGTPEDADPYRVMWFDLAVSNGVGMIDAGHSVLSPGSRLYQFHMPCLPDETPALGCGANNLPGLIQVRANDGLHFCPTWSGDPQGRCSVFASGARRYGFAMAEVVVRNHGF
jgi:hypothetical protein